MLIVVQKRAELVPSEPVCRALGGRGGHLLAHPGEQQVPLAVPERVVVGLEPVQIEKDQGGGLLLTDDALEIGDQLATVGEPGEDVAAGLLAQGVSVAGKHRGVTPRGQTTFDAPKQDHRQGAAQDYDQQRDPAGSA